MALTDSPERSRVGSLPSAAGKEEHRARASSEPTKKLSPHARERLSSDAGLLGVELQPEDMAFFRSMLRKRQQCEEEITSLEEQLALLDARIEDERRKRGLLEKEQDVNVIRERARKKFNASGKAGIRWLKDETEYFANGGTPEEVAEFLYTQEGLTKTAIGEYLGDYKEFNLKVLDAFVLCHDFTAMGFDEALRQYLWSFRLPGESQKIDRMMECFAKRFCECNPKAFRHRDACYILAFSVIMLNTR